MRMSIAKKRILFLVPSLIPGGAQRVFSTLLRHLDRNRFEIHLALLEAKGAYLGDVPGDVVVHDLRVGRMRYALPSIVKVAWKVRPATIFSTLAYLNLTLLMAKPLLPAKTSIVVRESTTPSIFLKEETRHPHLWEWSYRHFYRKADAVVCLSDSMVNELADRYAVPRARLVRIYNPVDAASLKQLAGAGANPFHGTGLKLVTAGRLSREKGTDVLLDAMPTVLRNFPETQLIILGDGPLEAELKEQARKLGIESAVQFAGFQQNPWPYLKHADFLVMPSRYEGLPNAALEALALGTPVIATDCPGAIREIQAGDDRVVLAAAEDPRALADAIISEARSRGANFTQNDCSQRLTQFDLQQVVGEYSRLF
jgi:glycosyltransferase involved in cell wall biosynthesis